MGKVFVPVAADFPQISGLRDVGSIITDLLDYVGGADRPESQARARRALAETVRAFNGMAWRFNRRTKDITFLDDTSEYPLHATTRDVWKVMLVDENSRFVDDVEFVPYEDFLRYDRTTISAVLIPNEYTIFNSFNEGKIRFLPRIGSGTFIYPTATIFYHKRIDVPSSDDDVMQVPIEVETAIVRQAAALLVARVRTFEEAARARADAKDITLGVQREWRDWPDFSQQMR
jgi:hypothetical protein